MYHPAIILNACVLKGHGSAGAVTGQGTTWTSHQSITGLRLAERQAHIHTHVHTYGQFRITV